MSGPNEDVARDVVVTLHPDQPGVLAVGVRAGEVLDVADDPEPSWALLLDAARQLAPDGAWPLGPHRLAPGFRVHVVQARGQELTPGARWSEEPDPSWPEPLRDAVRAVLDDDAGRAPIPPPSSVLAAARVVGRGHGLGRRVPRRDRTAPYRRRRTHGALGDLGRRSGAGHRRRPVAQGGPVDLPPGTRGAHGARRSTAGPGSGPVRHRRRVRRPALPLHDAGPVPAKVDADDPPRLAALLADLQVRTKDLLPRLVAAGAADRTPARLASELARVADDGFELDLLETAERARLRQLIPRLTDRLLALADGPLPEVLVHGDFHPWNVARPPGWSSDDAVVIDWTDAAVGPAGLDLVSLLPRSATAADRAPVTRAYAEVWALAIGVPPAEVEEAVVAARPAGHVVQALAYDEILRAMEPATRWQLAGAMAGHLRALLAASDEACPGR